MLCFLLPMMTALAQDPYKVAPKNYHLEFENDMREVLKSLSSIVRQVAAAGRRHFQMRIMPYRTMHNVIVGLVFLAEYFSGVIRKRVQ